MKRLPKVIIAFGTRPEAIKLAPVVKAFSKDGRFRTRVVVSAQHQEMLYQVLDLFKIKPHYDLNVMTPKQNLFNLSAVLLEKMQVVLEKERPDIVIVQGDTTTTFITALSAYYLKIPVAHVEAGLRSEDKHHPFPEEMNRILTSSLTDIHFAPTKNCATNLHNQGISKSKIHIVGNTIIDSLQYILAKSNSKQTNGKKFILVTAHRRENWGKPLENLCKAIGDISLKIKHTKFIFAVHKNPIVREAVEKHLKNNPNVELIGPQDYRNFINLLSRCYFALSDSGGIQEEAPVLGKPVLVFRETTERPEGVKAGVVKLVGQERKAIVKAALELLEDDDRYKKIAQARNLYGDGKSAERIVSVIDSYLTSPTPLATTAKR